MRHVTMTMMKTQATRGDEREGGRMQTGGKGEGRADACEPGGKGEGMPTHANRGAHEREGGVNRERER